ncbi:hypothetical protein KCU98_g13856, partial [Aureobasidium melanogenum]
MTSRSVLPENPEPLLGLSDGRKRTLVDEDTDAEDQANKRQHITPDIRDDDDISLDSDVESLFVETDDTEDTEMVDKEPEQGPVLWSADQEEYPPCAIYHEDVKKHQARIAVLAANVGVHSAKISSKGSDMAKLHAEAIAIQEFPEPKKIIIALMGDAGSGKSSLINSILDIPHIAKEGNYGSACTCAPTEYMSAFPEQTKKFAAKVEFLNAAQRCKLLKDHLRDYAFFNFEKDEDWTFEETKEYRAQAQTAEDTFLDLFHGKPFFNNREELGSHIRTVHESGTEAMFVAQLEVWCNELIAAHASSLHLGMIETDRAFQLRRALSPVLSSGNSSNDEPRLWPLVLKVRMIDYATNKVDQHARTFSEDLHKECHDIYNEVFNQFGGLVTEAEDDNKDVVTVKAALRDYLPYVVDEMADIIRRLKEIEKNPRPETIAPKSGKVKKEEKQQRSKVKTEVKHEQL